MNEKLEALKAYLLSMGLHPKENHVSRRLGILIDLKVKVNHRCIAVHIGDGNDDGFYKMVNHYYSPFFIRENESVEFVVEKMTNLVLKLKSMPFLPLEERIAKAKKRKMNLEYARQCEERHQWNIAHRKEIRAERKRKWREKKELRKALAAQPKRKRQRIVRCVKIEYNT